MVVEKSSFTVPRINVMFSGKVYMIIVVYTHVDGVGVCF
jgi:hypothetical protein